MYKISSLLIDGYNLIGIQHNDLSKQRERVIRLLSEYRKIKNHDITVVFDGWKSGSHREETSMVGGIRVIYSRLGETADAVIKRILAGDKKEWIVVSSDRDIAAFAWSMDCIPVPSDIFESVLGKASNSFSGIFEPIEEDDMPAVKKGRSRAPSRKEKALQKALKKL